MRLCFRYLREKRGLLLLYFLTLFLFVAVGSLYHIENLEKLLYAALLTLVLWGAAGGWDCLHYMKKCQQLERAFHHFSQSGELLLTESQARRLQEAEGDICSAEDFETAWMLFLALICERHAASQRSWEAKAAERGDYYMMWTHQIKTPISAMKLLLNESKLQDRDSFLLKEELLKIEQYVEMVLTYQRLESISADLVLETYDLDALLKRAVRKYSLSFINKLLSLEMPETTYEVLTDEKWFVFCLEQLLSNSLKYTAKGGISIRTWAREDRVFLSIEDTGIGIRSQDLPRIFEKGFTGYNGRLDKKSTGIGLYLCRQIFTHLNITIQVESEEGQGTKVILGIPAAGGRSFP